MSQKPLSSIFKEKAKELKIIRNYSKIASKVYIGKTKLKKPERQENLSQDQLNHEIVRLLSSRDSQKLKEVVWSHKNSTFVPNVISDPTVNSLHIDSEYLYKDSQDYKAYKGILIDQFNNYESNKKSNSDVNVIEILKPSTAKSKSLQSSQGIQNDYLKQIEKSKQEVEESEIIKKDYKDSNNESEEKVKDCSTQTENNPLIDEDHQTKTERKFDCKGFCCPSSIFDAYKRSLTGNKNRSSKGEANLVDKTHKRYIQISLAELSNKMEIALNNSINGLSLAERIIHLNENENLILDYAYFEDEADYYQSEGTLLPLWTFSYHNLKKYQVTGLTWSKENPDIFGACFGSYMFENPVSKGLVLLFNMRNHPSIPEKVIHIPCGAMSLDIHPIKSNFIAIGLHDGNCIMLKLSKNVREKEKNKPESVIYENNSLIVKHNTPVWTIKWISSSSDTGENNMSFVSAGMDGKLIQWFIQPQPNVKTAGEEVKWVVGRELFTLYYQNPPINYKGSDGTKIELFACARSMSMHKDGNTFLIGSNEGLIIIGSIHWNKFQRVYKAHFLPVSAVQWNNYDPHIFLSASEDWTIKLWSRRMENVPLLIWELGTPILDAAWAPYSSTVFACVTYDGKCLVYDISQNLESSICNQQVAAKNIERGYKIAFNPKMPLILIGDGKGSIFLMKLSPNLRKDPKDPDSGQKLEGEERFKAEILKLNKILRVTRDIIIKSEKYEIQYAQKDKNEKSDSFNFRY